MNTLKDNQSQDISIKAQVSNQKTCSEILANLVNVVPGTDKHYSYSSHNIIRNLRELTELRIRIGQLQTYC